VRLDSLVDLLLTAHENTTAVVNLFGLDVHHPLHLRVDGFTAGILHHHCHGRALVENSQLTLRRLLVGGVGEDTPVEQGSVGISNHGTDISGRVGLEVGLVGLVGGRSLEAVDVVDSWLRPVVRVTLVDRVNGALLGHGHIGVGENEFAEGVVLV